MVPKTGRGKGWMESSIYLVSPTHGVRASGSELHFAETGFACRVYPEVGSDLEVVCLRGIVQRQSYLALVLRDCSDESGIHVESTSMERVKCVKWMECLEGKLLQVAYVVCWQKCKKWRGRSARCKGM